MNYIKITPCDIANGPGVRTILWLSGCSHHCPECHNPQTWDKDAGKLFNKNSEKELYESLSKPFVQGITFSGGDPLNENNIENVLKLIEKIRLKYPSKDIWLYTGYTWESIMNSNEKDMKIRQVIIKNIDVLVDGPFLIDLKNISLLWKGSSNQRVIDVQKSIKEKKIVLYC